MEHLIEQINERLKRLDLPSYEELKPKIQSYLVQLEQVIQNKSHLREELIEQYKDSKISIAGIVKEIGISRQTVYNNKEVLESYINDAITSQEQSDFYSREKYLTDKIKYLEETIYLLQQRDITVEDLKQELSLLKRELASSYNINERLQEQNKELTDRIQELEGVLRNNNINVIDIQKKN